MQIKMVKAALSDDQAGDVILRGQIDPASLEFLHVADYQRERLAGRYIRALSEAIASKAGVPDIQLGMRGGSFVENRGTFLLNDEVYIIDGLQRCTAALELVKKGQAPRLGATVYFNTDEQQERIRFRNLNVSRVRLSANVLVHNERHDNALVEMAFQLCQDSTFVLYNRVCWQQAMKRSHLITAVTLIKAGVALHNHFIPEFRGDFGHTSIQVVRLNKVMTKLGRAAVRNNMKVFWQAMDDMFGVRNITYTEHASYMRSSFLVTLALVFTRHQNFWEDSRLVVPPELKRKISTFPINSPTVQAVLVWPDGRDEPLPRLSKWEFAQLLIDRIIQRMSGP